MLTLNLLNDLCDCTDKLSEKARSYTSYGTGVGKVSLVPARACMYGPVTRGHLYKPARRGAAHATTGRKKPSFHGSRSF